MLDWAENFCKPLREGKMKQTHGFDVSLIAVTGGPCGGKSTFLAKARQRLEENALRVAVVPEAATEIIQAGFSPGAGWVSVEHFQQHVLEYSLHREEMYMRMLEQQNTAHKLVLLCDRGAMDGEAYVGRTAFASIVRSLGHLPVKLRERYQAVVHLVTAANGAEKHYTLANNSARSESIDLAREIDRKTLAAWTGHQHHFVIDNSTDFDTKIVRAISAIARVLDMPTALEKERKFVVRHWSESLLLPDAVMTEITQDYLVSRVGEAERRVRKRVCEGVSTYYYTEKKVEIARGVRPETEVAISADRYEELLLERDPGTSTIVKSRHSMYYLGHMLEVDVYKSPERHAGLVTLEVEVRNMDERVNLPPHWQIFEVTGNREYSNFQLARNAA